MTCSISSRGPGKRFNAKDPPSLKLRRAGAKRLRLASNAVPALADLHRPLVPVERISRGEAKRSLFGWGTEVRRKRGPPPEASPLRVNASTAPQGGGGVGALLRAQTQSCHGPQMRATQI